MKTPHIPLRTLAAYGALGMPLAFAGLPVYLLVPDFYARQHGVSLAAMGVLLFSLRLGDAFLDPFLGWWADRRVHLRLPLMLLAGVGFGVGFHLLFPGPGELSGIDPLVWLGISMTLVYLSYSLLTVLYHSLGLGLTSDYGQRTRVAASREIAGLFGVLLAAALPSVLMQHMNEVDALHWLSVLFALLLLAALAALRPIVRKAAPPSDAVVSVRLLLKTPAIRWLLGVALLNTLPSAITTTLFLFFVRDVLQAPDSAGAFLAVYFLAAGAAAPLWVSFSNRVGKRQALFAAIMLSVIAFAWAFGLGPQNKWMFYIICFTSGTALAADVILPPSLLADILATRENAAGRMFGIWHALSKFALALAAGLTLPLLAGFGYSPSVVGQDIVVLSYAYALLPCVFKLLAALVLYLSPLDRERNIQ